jgi:hypothetical protein
MIFEPIRSAYLELASKHIDFTFDAVKFLFGMYVSILLSLSLFNIDFNYNYYYYKPTQ